MFSFPDLSLQEDFNLPEEWKNNRISHLYKNILSNKYKLTSNKGRGKGGGLGKKDEDSFSPLCHCNPRIGCNNLCHNRLLFMLINPLFYFLFLDHFFSSFSSLFLFYPLISSLSYHLLGNVQKITAQL